MLKKGFGGLPRPSRLLLGGLLTLVMLGVVLISSVSVFESHRLMERIEGPEFCAENAQSCNSFYFSRHLRHVAMGVVVFVLGILLPMRFWRAVALPMFGLSLLGLAVVLFSSLGADWGTANSWINIPGLPSIQPSEFAKFGMTLYFAAWMAAKQADIRTWRGGFLPFCTLLGLVVFPVALQPDFGSVLVLCAIGGAMFFVGGGRLTHLVIGALVAGLVSLPIIMSHDYIRDRFVAFLAPSAETQAGYQVEQSLIAVGSGQWFGVGVGESGQRYGWLPEIQSDTIFAAAAEELGFVRMMMVVGTFLMLGGVGMWAAARAQSRFAALVATGVATWVCFQAFVNMAVTLGIFPLTGITLPFISYGGSSLLTLALASGVLFRIVLGCEASAGTLRSGGKWWARGPRAGGVG